MLPFGHIASGYLVSYAVLQHVEPSLSVIQFRLLLILGSFFSFAPDLDFFLVFFKTKKMISNKEISHRKFSSHAPILWLIAGLTIFFLSGSLFWKYLGLLLWLGSWTHFAMDSIQHGIMWLWPFSNNIYAIRDKGVDIENGEKRFFRHWIYFLKGYFLQFKPTLFIELALIIAALAKIFIIK